MQFFTVNKRNEQNRRRTSLPDDILIPINAGRQLNPKKFAAGSFTAERPAYATSLKEWMIEKVANNEVGSYIGIRYPVGNSTYVRASNTGVTSSYSSGVLTLTSLATTGSLLNPIIHKVEVIGDSNLLDGNGDLTIKLVYEWDTDANESLTNITLPTITIWDMTQSVAQSEISTDNPATHTSTTPPVKSLVYVQDNDLHIKFENLNIIPNYGIAINL